jgi:putative hemolysin
MNSPELFSRYQAADLLPMSAPVFGQCVMAENASYRVRLALSDQERASLYRLRFLIFNLEMNEGLDAAYVHGEDRDAFDDVCDHLLVEDKLTGRIAGTYRLQTGVTAGRHIGYYSAQEFDFAPYEPFRGEIVELGRACIHREYRSFEVLNLLWRGIAQYAIGRGARYLIGCSSVNSQDTQLGSAMYHRLRGSLIAPDLQTRPTERFAFPLAEETEEKPNPPKLLRAYLAVGAKIGGVPAIDREFKTIDFLTFMDLENMAPSARTRYLR